MQLAAVRLAQQVCAARQRGDARASALPTVVALVARSFAGEPGVGAAAVGAVVRHAVALLGALDDVE